MPQERFNRCVHLLALATAVATLPLIFMGGLVTSHHAGMSVPDWPNSWGYNMFTFPISQWKGGIFYEHTHRLAGTAVGLLTVALVVAAWASDKRKWVRWMAVAVFLGASLQGILGGLRVIDSSLDLAIVHGCLGQIFFCFVAAFCVLSSRFWTRAVNLTGDESAAARKILILAAVAVGFIVMQLVVGAIMRQSDAGLAIPDFPASFGHILPPLRLDAAFRDDAIRRFGLNLGLNRVSLFQIWINFTHRLGAVLVSASIISLAVAIFRRLRRRELVWPAAILLLLLVTQLTLGMLTVWLRKPADIASLHVAVGSLVLVTAWVMLLRTYGLLSFGRFNPTATRSRMAAPTS